MSDNVTITGTTIAADDISGVQYQRTKIVWGVDGTATDVSASNPLPITGSLTVDSEFPAAGALADAAANPTTTKVGSHVLFYNGTTWDRATGTLANGLDVDVTRVQGTVTVDSELPSAGSLADATANPTAPAVGSHLLAYNGTTWDRVISTQGALKAASVMLSSGSLVVENAASGATDSNSGSAHGASASLQFNGSSYERQRGNTEGALLASSVRATDTNSANQTNYNARGVIIYINVDIAAAGETVTPKLYLRDTTSSADFLIWTGAAINVSGLKAYLFYPGTTSTSYTEAVDIAISRSWYLTMDHSASGNWTYSASYSYIL